MVVQSCETIDIDHRQEALIVAEYAKFVAAIAWNIKQKYRLPHYLDTDDLEQTALLALVEAIRKIDWHKNDKEINHFLKRRMWGAMLDEIRHMLPVGRYQERVFISSYEELAENHQELVEDNDCLLAKLTTHSLLQQITDNRKRDIVYRHYFCDEFFEEIAKTFKKKNGKPYTASRIGQLHWEAIEEMRNSNLNGKGNSF